MMRYITVLLGMDCVCSLFKVANVVLKLVCWGVEC